MLLMYILYFYHFFAQTASIIMMLKRIHIANIIFATELCILTVCFLIDKIDILGRGGLFFIFGSGAGGTGR